MSLPAPPHDPAALAAWQLEQLQALLHEVLPRNPFYAAKLAGVPWAEPAPSLRALLDRLPFTTKAELVADQQAHPPYGTDLTYALSAYTRLNQTSGSSGATPVRWLDTPDSWQTMLDCWKLVLHGAGLGPGDRLFFAFSFGPFLGFWTAFEAACQLGCLCLPGGGLSTLGRLQTMLDNQATALFCTPTYALRLGETARAEGVDLSRSAVRRILVAGEPGGSIPAVRAAIEKLWSGARVVDHHGLTEVGPVSFECRHADQMLHVIEAAYIAELIEPGTNRVLPPGESGELVLTNLRRAGSPLLRYRTGDLVRVAPCDCGCASVGLVGGILGRVDDMVIVRGVNLYPAAVEAVLRQVPGVAEYRAHVTTVAGMAEMELEVEPAADVSDPAALCARLAAALRAAFHLRLPVRPAAIGSLPRFELKAKRWLRPA